MSSFMLFYSYSISLYNIAQYIKRNINKCTLEMSILHLKLHSRPEEAKSNIRDKSFIVTIDLRLVNDGKLLSLGHLAERWHQHFPM